MGERNSSGDPRKGVFGHQRAQICPVKHSSGAFRSPHLSHFLFKCIFVVPHSGGWEPPPITLPLIPTPLVYPYSQGCSFWREVCAEMSHRVGGTGRVSAGRLLGSQNSLIFILSNSTWGERSETGAGQSWKEERWRRREMGMSQGREGGSLVWASQEHTPSFGSR